MVLIIQYLVAVVIKSKRYDALQCHVVVVAAIELLVEVHLVVAARLWFSSCRPIPDHHTTRKG